MGCDARPLDERWLQGAQFPGHEFEGYFDWATDQVPKDCFAVLRQDRYDHVQLGQTN